VVFLERGRRRRLEMVWFERDRLGVEVAWLDGDAAWRLLELCLGIEVVFPALPWIVLRY
jgi:hypothetical protein